MPGYADDAERTASCMAGGYYRTGDVATRDSDGYFTYVGRDDDLFKSSDYRLSPFELESALIEHQAIAEAAVVPSPDAIRWNVPKAYLSLKPGVQPSRNWLATYFALSASAWVLTSACGGSSLPNCPRPSPARFAACNCAAWSRSAQHEGRRPGEYWEEDFPELKDSK